MITRFDSPKSWISISGEHVVLSLLHISTGLVSLHISLYQIQASRKNTQSLSSVLGSMTGQPVFIVLDIWIALVVLSLQRTIVSFCSSIICHMNWEIKLEVLPGAGSMSDFVKIIPCIHQILCPALCKITTMIMVVVILN